MAFYEVQAEEILTGTFISKSGKRPWGGHRSPDTANDLDSWQYATIQWKFFLAKQQTIC